MWPARVTFGPFRVPSGHMVAKCVHTYLNMRAHLQHEWGQFGTIWAHLGMCPKFMSGCSMCPKFMWALVTRMGPVGYLMGIWWQTEWGQSGYGTIWCKLVHTLVTRMGTLVTRMGTILGQVGGRLVDGGRIWCKYGRKSHPRGKMCIWAKFGDTFGAKMCPKFMSGCSMCPKFMLAQIGTYLNMREITLMRFCIQLCTNSCHNVS